MSAHNPSPVPVTNSNPDYTDSDIAFGPLVKWTLSLWVITAIVFAVMIWWFRHEREAALALHPKSGPAAERLLPPAGAPLLQANPIRDLDEYKAEMDGKLHRYAVLDAAAGVYQIPIEQAMKRILEKGALK